MADTAFDYREFLPTVPERPGCYRMYDDRDTVIYVGKAKNLKNRLSQYFHGSVAPKTAALVRKIHHIEFTVTFSETEALLLENNLIKKYQPRYNILLRDDKSYPYLFISSGPHPGLYYHRGAQRLKGEYFGPYPDASAVHASLRLIQGIFPLRQCTDMVYAHRSRPCLMAQMGRCLAPCVPMDEKGEAAYAEQVDMVRLFLRGQNQTLLQELTARMTRAAEELRFEEAARLRDQLRALRRVQESQSVTGEIRNDMDVVAMCSREEGVCVHVLFIRGGRIVGTRSYFPEGAAAADAAETFSSFVEQFYLSDSRGGRLPAEVVLGQEIDFATLAETLRQRNGSEVRFVTSVRGARARFLKLAETNAEASLQARLISSQTARRRITALEALLARQNVMRMECYDISHTQGELTVASCVCFGREGPESSRYRRFNIEGITPGDDFAAMRQTLERRFREPKEAEVPQIIFIDGGLGQLGVAEEVIEQKFSGTGLEPPLLVGVAKGEGRRPGLETLIEGYTHAEHHLELDDPALQLVLQIRDEAHRFAITGHRRRRAKARQHSELEDLPGIGPGRRQALLSHLGGIREVKRAGIEDLKKVPGISAKLAEEIYQALHDL